LDYRVVEHQPTTNKEPTMTTYRVFTRSFTTLSAILTLAIGVAATVAPSTARAENGVFSAFVDDVDDASFMDYTDDACTSSGQADADACAAPSRAIHNTSGTTVKVPATGSPAPAAGQTNIIMRDGGICDPIRHMGC
jgi:hypothetical protein